MQINCWSMHGSFPHLSTDYVISYCLPLISIFNSHWLCLHHACEYPITLILYVCECPIYSYFPEYAYKNSKLSLILKIMSTIHLGLNPKLELHVAIFRLVKNENCILPLLCTKATKQLYLTINACIGIAIAIQL